MAVGIMVVAIELSHPLHPPLMVLVHEVSVAPLAVCDVERGLRASRCHASLLVFSRKSEAALPNARQASDTIVNSWAMHTIVGFGVCLR